VQTDVGQVENLALADPEAPRFVWWDKQLRPTPDGLPSLPTFTLLSPLGKVGVQSPAVLPHHPAPACGNGIWLLQMPPHGFGMMTQRARGRCVAPDPRGAGCGGDQAGYAGL
jgi:hypothetical protein